MQLTPQAADEPKDDPLIVEGIMARYGFHPGRVAERTDDIAALPGGMPYVSVN